MVRGQGRIEKNVSASTVASDLVRNVTSSSQKSRGSNPLRLRVSRTLELPSFTEKRCHHTKDAVHKCQFASEMSCGRVILHCWQSDEMHTVFAEIQQEHRQRHKPEEIHLFTFELTAPRTIVTPITCLSSKIVCFALQKSQFLGQDTVSTFSCGMVFSFPFAFQDSILVFCQKGKQFQKLNVWSFSNA